MTTLHMNDPLVGHVLEGRYEITSRLARGGMATVYVAEDLRLARTVAVKIMHEGLGDDRDFTRKFDREARAAARLIHPNITAVFDQGSDNGRPYIVMEYVAGQTLRGVISRDAPLTPRRALTLMEPILAALACAHENGYVHRDVKPENVLISERGEVKVADFGLAKAISGDTVTATQGLLIGTVSYIPPELVAEGRADAHSDVYSAGIVLFELMTGRKPHTGDTPIQVAYAHCNKDVPAPSSLLESDWRTDRDAIPPYLDALVQAATRRDTSARIRDARVFLERLRLARQALERGVMDDARLTELMLAPSDVVDAPTAVLPTSTAINRATQNKWVPRSAARPAQRQVPATPVSPIDMAAATTPIPFYDALPEVHRTPIERSVRLPKAPAVIAKAPRKGRPATATATHRRRRRGVVALLLVLLMATGIGAGAWWTFSGQYVPSPALAGMTRDDAFASAQASKLTVTFTDEYSEDVPTGTVIRTAPDAGTKVRQGGSIEAFLSRGPERYAAPTLIGLQRSLAEEAIRGANLSVGAVVETFSDTAAAGVVIDASVAPGAMLKKSTAIDLSVSKGPAPIGIASFVGKKGEEAKAALTKAGFRVSVTEENSKTVAAGLVISQTPDGGQGRKGDAVTIVVSKGPVMVTVPNTRGMQAAAATKALEDKGFVVKVSQLPNPVPFGTVSYSDPTGGKTAPEGSTVTIYVA